jgi:phosphoglucomutase
MCSHRRLAPSAPAPEKITDAIYTHTTRIGQYKLANIPEVDLAALGEHKFGKFSVEIVDSVDNYWQLMKSIFPIDSIKKLVARPEFKVRLDSMNGGARSLALSASNMPVSQSFGLTPACVLQ